MLAVKAKVENGNLRWLENPPEINAEVLVVFSVEAKPTRKVRKKMSDEEAIQILNKYAGSIDRDPKGFVFSGVPAISPEDYLNSLT